MGKRADGVLSSREVALVGRVVDRVCAERGHKPGSVDSEDVAVSALRIFQSNRDLDDASLEAALRGNR